MRKIPTLGAVAQAQAENEKAEKGKGLIARGLQLLGIMPAAETKPEAKMTKRTLTTKRVEMEESDEDTGAEVDDEESTGSDVEESTGAEAEDEGAEASDAESEGEAKAITRAAAKAYEAAEAAYQAAIKDDPLAQALALRSPARLRHEAKRATGAKTTGDAMAALSRLRHKSADEEARAIQNEAKLEARIAAVETDSRKLRVDALVDGAKAAGKAPRRALRAELREYGMKHGTKRLSKLIASLSVVAPVDPKLPNTDEQGKVRGGPTDDQQARMMEQGASGLSPKEREEFYALANEKLKMNGAGTGAPEA